MEIKYRRRGEGKIASGMSGKVTRNHTINYLLKKEKSIIHVSLCSWIHG